MGKLSDRMGQVFSGAAGADKEKIQDLEKRLAASQEVATKNEEALSDKTKQLASLEEAHARTTQDAKSQAERAKALEDQCAELQQDRDHLRSQTQQLRNDLEHLRAESEAKAAASKKDLADAHDNYTALQTSHNGLSDELADTKRQLTEHTARQASLQQKYDSEAQQHQADFVKSQKDLRDAEEARNQLTAAHAAEMEKNKHEKEELQGKVLSTGQQYHDLKQKDDAQTTELENLKKTHEETQNKLNAVTEEKKKVQTERDALDAEMKEAYADLDRMTSGGK